jgi:ribosomal protein S18 acetylase RimI-like enzyme
MRGVVTVRRAESDDVAALAKLTEEGEPHPGRSRSESPADRERRFEELIDDPRRVILVACDKDQSINGLLVATTEDIGTLHPVPALTVSTLVVAPSSRRRGVGRALLAHSVQEAERRGIDCLVASVSGSDRDANRYLARLGFAPLVVRRLAPIATLRRTLGMNEAMIRTARWHRRGLKTLAIRGLSNRS